MDMIHTDDLAQLTADRGCDRVSLFMPTHRGPSGRHRNRVRCTRLLQRAKRALRGGGMPTARINTVLEGARELLDDMWLWERPGGGVALFIGPTDTRCFRLPLPPPELVTIGDRFTIGPLLPMVTSGGRFFVLALSQDDVQLFEGTRCCLDRMALHESPLALLQTMPRPQRVPVSTFLAGRGGAGRAAAVFHGVGGGDDDRKELVLQHFHRVDRALRDTLGDEQTPLVVAGVGYLQALYRKANTYPRLLTSGITGSPRDMPHDLVHRKAWEIVEPELRAHEAEALENHRAFRGTGLTLGNPAEVLTAAEQGRVDTLFVSTTATRGDHVSAGTEAIVLEGPPADGEYPGLATAATLRHAGSLFVVPAQRMPEDTSVAALLRY